MRNWIDSRLKELGKSKSALGVALGIPHPRVHELITGKRELKTIEIPAFADFLELTPSQAIEYYTGAKTKDLPPSQSKSIPLISWVSAGEVTDQMSVMDLDDFPIIQAAGLPNGNWVALRVDGSSMNKISPPDSIIFVDMSDRGLVPNGLYIIADETGQATYKRYEPEHTPPFQPASYKDITPPELTGTIRVIGRVKRSMIET